jgi:2-polyprenyl-3-methyl-5-hydroxy-6-metoxy-1,4-benzoquinol methylase
MDIDSIVEKVIEQRKSSLIGLFGNSGRQIEFLYLDSLKPSWIRTIQDLISLVPKGGTVLEIGSFFGIVSISLSKLGFIVVAFDRPEIQINSKIMKSYLDNQIQIVSGDLKDIPSVTLPFKNDLFDFVVICEVLEHLNFNPIPVLQDIHRVIKPGGMLYLSVPNQTRLRNRWNILCGRSIRNPIEDFINLPEADHHWREYTLIEIDKLLALCDFSIRKNYYWSGNSLSINRKLLIKLLKKSIPSFRDNITAIARKT